ncbi:MAG: sigma factor-like helix-turn-helix DNA-binding protein [bacterium]|nr:sigma factor-like helix-turn-helix DNA-binding protein [bacterium]MDZ4296488.1 sigma factor-like helix-turn-helix DNA-binding protein [Patescibacteria group bacterium]
MSSTAQRKQNSQRRSAASLNASALTRQLLVSLPKRMVEVLERRFGLVKGRCETLEAIGHSHDITRERVRQIEAYALGVLRRSEIKKLMLPFVADARLYFERYGGLRRRDLALADLAQRWGNGKNGSFEAEFILEASKDFYYQGETASTQAFWALDRNAVRRSGEFIRALMQLFKEERRLLNADELVQYLHKARQRVYGKATLGTEALLAHVEIAKGIAKNPFGMYGLSAWSEVSPRGVRDFAYLVFRQLARPLHFREVAKHMNEMLALKRHAHEQTVHNELIKDQRFVLVGRGIYALREWGYEAGTVREVLATILAQSAKALSKEEIMERMKGQRLVKENTVFLNLQNRKYFVRLADGRYSVRKGGVTVESA